jgi:ERO1-like protein alpha
MICNFHTCSICQCEESEIPLPWKQESSNDDIDRSIDEKFQKWFDKYNYSSPYWLVENEIDSRNGIYVNLEKNPEAFTGYQGQHIWNAIYVENCFGDNSTTICREDEVLYKIISGLHANINAHLSKNYLDINNNSTFFNTTMLYDRVLTKPDRINNLFFLYSLLLKSFMKIEPIVKNYYIHTGNEGEDNNTKELIDELYNTKLLNNTCNHCFRSTDAVGSFLNVNQLDQIKSKFRNISQIIDCVSCQKCKLHGKLQIYGLATMLKILFTSNLTADKLKRNELISFINLVGKVSQAIRYITEGWHIEKENIWGFWYNYFETFVIIFSISLLVRLNFYFIKNKEKYSGLIDPRKRYMEHLSRSKQKIFDKSSVKKQQ